MNHDGQTVSEPEQKAQEYLLSKKYKQKKVNKLLNVYLYIYNLDANRNVSNTHTQNIKLHRAELS